MRKKFSNKVIIFNQAFYKPFIKIKNDPIEISKIYTVLNKDIEAILKEIKFKLCVVCEQNIAPGGYILKTPCSCCLCSMACANKYISSLIHYRKKDESKFNITKVLNCICTYDYKVKDLKLLYLFTHKNKLKVKEGLLPIFDYAFNRNCMLCLKSLNKGERLIADLSDSEVKDHVESFTHSICLECYIPNEVRSFHCHVCDRSHIIKAIRKESNSNCLII
jgi:hypothetical protein